MYSHESISIYGELLKMADIATIGLVKEAGLLSSLGMAAKPLEGAAMRAMPHATPLAGLASHLGQVAKSPGDVIANRVARGVARAAGRGAPRAVPNAATGAVAGAARGAAGSAGAAEGGGLLRKAMPYLAGGGLAAGAGLGAYNIGRGHAEEAAKSRRNLAFGAGAATGLALPGLLRGAANTAQSMSLSPASLFSGGEY